MIAATGLPGPRRVLLDSSGYLALDNANDTQHPEARAAWARLTEERWHTFTTNFVLAETHALFLARLDRRSASAFLRQFDHSTTTLVRVSARDEARARAIVFQYDDKDFSLTDASSFAVMERLRIGTAFGFDRNFVQFGILLIGPDAT